MLKLDDGCMDRVGQVLSAVEERSSLGRHELQTLVPSSVCAVGHDLRMATLSGRLLVSRPSGDIALGPEGAEWLMEYGRPAPDWQGESTHGPPLRNWQVEALDAWSRHGRRGVIQAVTGTGKSRVGIEAIREAVDHDYSALVVVPTIDLVDQWTRQLRAAQLGTVGSSPEGSVSFGRHQIFVGTVSSLYAAPPTRADGKVLLVADECHRYGAEQWGRVLDPSYRRRLGLTATFERNDDGLAKLLPYFHGTPVYEIGFRQAIDEGAVAHYDVKLLGVDLTAAERRAYDEADESARDARTRLLATGFPDEPFGHFLHEVQKAADFDEDPTIEDAARRYLKAFSRRIDVMTNARAKFDLVPLLAPLVREAHGSLVFTRRVEAAEEIANSLRSGGVKAAAVHGEVSRHERSDRLAELRAGVLEALVAPTVLDEGIDVPHVDLGIVMGGSKSRRQMIQRMGRVLRLKRGGRKATLIVVYAHGTAEDLSRESGAEGCLDLIIEAADSVTYADSVAELLSAHGALAEGRAEGTAICPPPTAETQPPGGTSDLGRRAVAPGPDGRLLAIDASTLPMTRKALTDYQRAHGVDEGTADADLRELLRAMQESAFVRNSRTYGVFVAKREGFELAVSPDRFAGYRSLRSDGLTWSELQYAEPKEMTGSHLPDAPAAEELDEVPPPIAPSEGATSPEQSGGTAAATPGPLYMGATAPVVLRDNDQDSRAYRPGPSDGEHLMAHLERLVELHEAGLLTQAEFGAAKARLLF